MSSHSRYSGDHVAAAAGSDAEMGGVEEPSVVDISETWDRVAAREARYREQGVAKVRGNGVTYDALGDYDPAYWDAGRFLYLDSAVAGESHTSRQGVHVRTRDGAFRERWAHIGLRGTVYDYPNDVVDTSFAASAEDHKFVCFVIDFVRELYHRSKTKRGVSDRELTLACYEYLSGDTVDQMWWSEARVRFADDVYTEHRAREAVSGKQRALYVPWWGIEVWDMRPRDRVECYLPRTGSLPSSLSFLSPVPSPLVFTYFVRQCRQMYSTPVVARGLSRLAEHEFLYANVFSFLESARGRVIAGSYDPRVRECGAGIGILVPIPETLVRLIEQHRLAYLIGGSSLARDREGHARARMAYERSVLDIDWQAVERDMRCNRASVPIVPYLLYEYATGHVLPLRQCQGRLAPTRGRNVGDIAEFSAVGVHYRRDVRGIDFYRALVDDYFAFRRAEEPLRSVSVITSGMYDEHFEWTHRRAYDASGAVPRDRGWSSPYRDSDWAQDTPERRYRPVDDGPGPAARLEFGSGAGSARTAAAGTSAAVPGALASVGSLPGVSVNVSEMMKLAQEVGRLQVLYNIAQARVRELERGAAAGGDSAVRQRLDASVAEIARLQGIVKNSEAGAARAESQQRAVATLEAQVAMLRRELGTAKARHGDEVSRLHRELTAARAGGSGSVEDAAIADAQLKEELNKASDEKERLRQALREAKTSVTRLVEERSVERKRHAEALTAAAKSEKVHELEMRVVDLDLQARKWEKRALDAEAAREKGVIAIASLNEAVAEAHTELATEVGVRKKAQADLRQAMATCDRLEKQTLSEARRLRALSDNFHNFSDGLTKLQREFLSRDTFERLFGEVPGFRETVPSEGQDVRMGSPADGAAGDRDGSAGTGSSDRVRSPSPRRGRSRSRQGLRSRTARRDS